jgi:hypothetical protein
MYLITVANERNGPGTLTETAKSSSGNCFERLGECPRTCVCLLFFCFRDLISFRPSLPINKPSLCHRISSNMQSTTTQLTAPKSSRTLRERCGITFNLTLTPNANDIAPIKETSQPIFGKLPRRKKLTTAIPNNAPPMWSPPPTPPVSPPPKANALGSKLKKIFFHRRQKKRNNNTEWIAGLDDIEDVLLSPTPHRFAQQDESRCLQEIIPGCYVAFEDDTAAWIGNRSKDSLATPNGRSWTHVVSICEASNPSSSSSCSSSDDSDSVDDDSSITYDTEVQTLRISLPPAPDANADDEDVPCTSLTVDQLLATRNFLSLYGDALNWDPLSLYRDEPSCSSSCTSPCEDYDPSPPVRLLITVPRNRRADALSVATCYLAFAFNVCVDTFLRDLDSRQTCIPIWKHAVDSRGVQFVERVVAM